MSPRPRIQRAFLEWLDEVRNDFSVPVRIKRRTDRWINLSFKGLTPALSVTLTRLEINVWVVWPEQDEVWDLLVSLDALPRRTSSGYICEYCAEGDRIVFPSREALWRDHLFELFRNWVNEKVAPADALALYEMRGATWAVLVKSESVQDDPVVLIPLRS